MTIQNRDATQPFITADGSTIREIVNASNSNLKNQSLAEATLALGQCTTLHFHPLSEEIYFVLEGAGVMHIEGESRTIGVGDAVAIPSGHKHQICNPKSEILRFLCICAPPYSDEDTVLINEKSGVV